MAGRGEDNHSTGSSCGSKCASRKLWKAKCTKCFNPIGAFFENEIQMHPFIEVLVCKRCFKHLTDSGSWTQDANGKDEHCRWCGNSGTIIPCDYCPHGFCTSCIKRNLGRTYVDNLMANIDNDPAFQFKCFCCEATPLQKLHNELTQLRNIFESRPKRTSNSAGLKQQHVIPTRKSRKRPKIEPPGSDVRDEQIKPVNFPEAIADDAENLPIVKEAAIKQAKRKSNTANASESIILPLDSDSAHDEEPHEVDRAPNASKSKNQSVKRSAIEPLSSKVTAVVCSDSDDEIETFAKRVGRSMEERSKKSGEPAGNQKKAKGPTTTHAANFKYPVRRGKFRCGPQGIDHNESVADVKKGRGKKNASGQSEKDSAEDSASCPDVDEAEVKEVAKKRVKQAKPGDLSFV